MDWIMVVKEGDAHSRSRRIWLSSTTRTRALSVEESTVPMEDFNRIPPVPTVTVGLSGPSKVGERVLGRFCAANLGTYPDIAPDRDSMVMDRGPRSGLESAGLMRSELCLLGPLAMNGITWVRVELPRKDGTLDR